MVKMMTVFYFSGTGNTKYIGNHLVAGMEAFGWNTALVSISGLSSTERDKLIAKSDVIVLAYPIYGSDMPELMRQFIGSLPPGNGKPLAVVCTQLAFSGDGGSILFRALSKNGYNQRWSYQVNMPNNLCIKGSPFFQSADFDVHERKHLVKARMKVAGMAFNIDSDRRRIGDHSPIHLILGWFQRPAFRAFGLSYYKKALTVDSVKCIGCGKCVRSCPVGVLEMNESKAIYSDRESCQSCLRCMNFCPASAIMFNGTVKQPLYKGPTRDSLGDLFR